MIGSYTTSDTSSSVSCQNSCEADNSCDAWLIGEDDSGAAGRCRLYSELAGVLTFACTQGNYVREPGNYGAVKLRVTDALGTMECDNRTRVDADKEKYDNEKYLPAVHLLELCRRATQPDRQAVDG